ncbi:MAG: phoC [Phenylobacterium sp.]|nr:phoC [Phenylobacterium sp.]
MLRHLLIGGAVAALAACATAPAPPRDTSMGPSSNKVAGYLTADALDGRTILPPPPAADSAYGKADRAYFDDTRALKDTPRWRLAIQDNDLWQGGALKRFSCAMGVDVSEQATPVAWKMLHRIEVDVRTVGTPAKDFFDRKRPLIGNDKPLCVPREKWMETNASYPSGHSMVAWSWALILSEAVPARADALLRMGQESGESRTICGVHFPSDVEAGRTLGAGMVARLHADPAFAADLAKAKMELASAPAPSGCGV